MTAENPAVDEEAPAPAPAPARGRWRLLPPGKKLGRGPYVQLLYLALFFFDPIFLGRPPVVWAATVGAILVFLPLYFSIYWLEGWWRYLPLAGIVSLGLLLAPWNTGTFGFFIYAAAFLGYLTRPRRAVLGLVIILALVALETWWLELSIGFWLPAVAFVVIIGLSQIYYGERQRQDSLLRRSRQEVARLARVAERERIARDLHDLLGHTLSVITLKAELAGKLVSRDPGRAEEEIRQVEQTARDGLEEVRRAVTGYRRAELAVERVQAELALETAGVTLEWRQPGTLELEPVVEHTFALAVREAATNVVRHAAAHRCRVVLDDDGGRVHLEVSDDGRGRRRGGTGDGAGLDGMRERAEDLGGRLETLWGRAAALGGTTLRMSLPTIPRPLERADRPPGGSP